MSWTQHAHCNDDESETGVRSAKRSLLNFDVGDKFPIDRLVDLTPVVNAMMKWLSTALLALIAACGLGQENGPGVVMTVVNVGTVTMHAISVNVTGNAYPIGDLGPGASTSIAVHPAGDSHIVLAFDGARRLPIDCYLERGGRGKLTASVTPERVVAIHDKTILPGCSTKP